MHDDKSHTPVPPGVRRDVTLEAQMTPEEFAQFQLALRLAKEPCEPKSTENVSAESPEIPTTESLAHPNNVDALMNLAETFLARGAASRPAAERAQLFVHFKEDPLGPNGQWGAFLEDGSRVPAETFRRLTSDISFVAVNRDNRGDVLDIGRRTRVIPPAIARALSIRDEGQCRVPGCMHRTYLHAHHVRH